MRKFKLKSNKSSAPRSRSRYACYVGVFTSGVEAEIFHKMCEDSGFTAFTQACDVGAPRDAWWYNRNNLKEELASVEAALKKKRDADIALTVAEDRLKRRAGVA